MEIVERSSGYWLVDGSGAVDGPFATVEAAGRVRKELETVKTVRVIVAALNASGEPDLFFCKVRCTGEQYNNAEHYVLAERKAIDEGYEPRLAFDENDCAGKAILDKFNWNTASTYTT